MGSNKGKSRADRAAQKKGKARCVGSYKEAVYDPVALAKDSAYADSVWPHYRKVYAEHEQELWTALNKVDQYPKSAKLWIIFATSALFPEICSLQQKAHPLVHSWVCKRVRDAFNGRGRDGSNERKVLARMVHRLRTNTYAKAIVCREKEAGDGELTPDSAGGVHANKDGVALVE